MLNQSGSFEYPVRLGAMMVAISIAVGLDPCMLIFDVAAPC